MLSPLEIAAGIPLPERESRLTLEPTDLTPRAALEQAILGGLQRTPCVVSFSGGRDSSLVLAAAVDVARREGLPMPVPVTVRVSGDAQDEEHLWQETVVAHLGLDDWVRVSISDEFDCIGPIAQQGLLRHGVLWPANTHFHVPQFEHAAGGVVLTGIGGDELLSSSQWTGLHQLAAGKERLHLSHLRQLAALIAPLPIRRRAFARRRPVEIEWLRPDAERTIAASVAQQAAAEPLRWRSRFEWMLGLRYLKLARLSLDTLATDWGSSIQHPLLAPGFASSLASLPRARRFASRSEALAELFGDLLPGGLATRTSKAVFAGTLWGEASRTFAASWDGRGVDPELVDVAALRERWAGGGEGPYSLLQSIWLEAQRASQARATAPSRPSTDRSNPSQERGRRNSQAGSALS